MDSIRFENNEIFEINGSSKTQFSGTYTPNTLADKLIDEWIPYYECHKCGKGDYCKFTIPNSGNPLKKLDIKCRVAAEALRNFILRTIFVLESASKFQKQKYLDTSFYFYKYVIDSEQWNGSFIDKDKLDWWGDYAKKFYSQIIPIRDTLNELGNCLKEFPELYNGTSLLLVEGETELTFIENLKADGSLSRMWEFVVDSYGGKGNKLPKRIKMLLDDYKAKGYSIYIQGDEDGTGDGTGYDKFKEYVNQGYLSKEKIFQFQYDFENAIPKKLLYQVLLEFGFLGNIPFNEFDNKTMHKSINESLKLKFGIDTEKENLKKRIAKFVGNAIFHLDHRIKENLKKRIAKFVGNAIFHLDHRIKDKFDATELGRFVLFLDKIR